MKVFTNGSKKKVAISLAAITAVEEHMPAKGDQKATARVHVAGAGSHIVEYDGDVADIARE